MTEQQDFSSRALAFFERTFVDRSNGAPDASASRRRAAADAFARIGLPTKRTEEWKYTPVARALRHPYALDVPAAELDEATVAAFGVPGLGAHRIVVLNGRYVPELSSVDAPGVTATGLRGAAHKGGLEGLGAMADVEGEAFAALNAAFETDGLFLDVAPNTVVEKPIEVIVLTDTPADVLVQARHLIRVGRGAEVSVIESRHVRGGGQTFANVLTEVEVGENASANVIRLQDEGAAASAVCTTYAVQGRDSRFRHQVYTFSGRLVRNNVRVRHAGEGCHSELLGLYVADGQMHVDNHTRLDHATPHCTSDELYKGILADASTGVFNGKVHVHRDAQQTNAYQQSQAIVLSDAAKSYSKPELEIYADDVKCSHGSTTGELDPDAVFYLRARGIGHKEAQALLLYAFAHDVIDRIAFEPLREHVDALVHRVLDASLAAPDTV